MKYDKEDMIDVLEDFPEQCKRAVQLAKGVKVKGKFSNICVCGMGGSGIGGELIKGFVKDIPVFNHHDYSLPKYVNKKSLVIAVSYSGNTAETLSAFNEAKKRKAKVISITSGGKLAEKDRKALLIPPGLQPRAAIGYLFLTMLAILSNNKIIPNQSKAIAETMRILNVKETRKKAFMLAKKMNKKIPVFYASEDLEAVAYRMKTQVNENAKQPAFCHTVPEMNHNEINGYKNQGKKLVAVFIKDKQDRKEIIKRMEINKSLIRKSTNIYEIDVKGRSLLARMLSTIYIGDFASYYLALMNKEDPTPVPLIVELKKRLSK